jgi:hypothetical protein
MAVSTWLLELLMDGWLLFGEFGLQGLPAVLHFGILAFCFLPELLLFEVAVESCCHIKY